MPAISILRIFHPRRQRRVERIEISQEPVKVRGEELHEIWWRGKQWAVTAYGIECLDGCYHIKKDRLLEQLIGEHPYPWPLHMAEKDWVDPDEFCTAWIIAILLHGYGRQKYAAPIRQSFARLPPRRP
jgi:hypothetical protein